MLNWTYLIFNNLLSGATRAMIFFNDIIFKVSVCLSIICFLSPKKVLITCYKNAHASKCEPGQISMCRFTHCILGFHDWAKQCGVTVLCHRQLEINTKGCFTHTHGNT